MGFTSPGDGAQSLQAPDGKSSPPGAPVLLVYCHLHRSQQPTGCFTRSWWST